MIQIATTLPAISVGPARPALIAAQNGTSNFALALSSLLVPGAAPKGEAGELPAADAPVAARQLVAEPGKELPEIGLDLTADDEAPDESDADPDAPAGEEVAFAWFALPAAPAPEAPAVAAPAIAPNAVVAETPATAIALPPIAVPGEPQRAAKSAATAPAEVEPVGTEKPVVETKARPAAESAAEAEPAPAARTPVETRVAPAGVSAVASKSVPAARPAIENRVAPATKPALEAKPVPAAVPAIDTKASPAAGPAETAGAPVRVDSAHRVAPLQSLPERPVAAAPRATVRIDPGPATDAPAPIAPAPAPAPVIAAVAPAHAAPTPTAPAPLVQVPLAADVIPVTPSAAQQPAAPPQTPAPEAVAVSPATVDMLAPRTQATPVAQPARQLAPEAAPRLTVASLIAQASAQAASAQPAAFAPLRRISSEPDQPALTSITAPSAAILQQVAATPDAQHGALDLRRQEWLGKMVETIEAMRDAAPVKETRISLVPDALGKVDISVRHEGDRVHVHFAAETQAARQILTDAQPRLTELAEQRGIRLGQTSVDAQNAGAQSGQRHNEAPRPQAPLAPAGARAAKDQFTHTDDDRVA